MLIDNRNINLNWAKVNHAYAIANAKVFVEPPRKIGSAITSVAKMISSGKEMEVYMPSILSSQPNNPNWNKLLKNYWDSLTFEVGTGGEILEIGFQYDISDPDKQEFIKTINEHLDKDSKLTTDEDLRDYFRKQRRQIEIDFKSDMNKANKMANSATKENHISSAYATKYKKIIQLEQNHYKLGTPIDTLHYLIYRYCLVYGDVANEFALVKKSPGKIRFYLQSVEELESLKQEIQKREETRMKYFLDIISDSVKLDSMLYALKQGGNIKNATPTTKHTILNKVSTNDPERFISMCNDKNLTLVGTIEMLLSYNILNKLEGSSIIVDSVDPSLVIGNNMSEAISYFANKDNEVKVNEFILKVKNLKN